MNKKRRFRFGLKFMLAMLTLCCLFAVALKKLREAGCEFEFNNVSNHGFVDTFFRDTIYSLFGIDVTPESVVVIRTYDKPCRFARLKRVDPKPNA